MYKYRAKAWKNKCKTWFVTHTGYVWEKTLEMFPTLIVNQDIVILAQDSANFHKNELPMPIDRKYHK